MTNLEIAKISTMLTQTYEMMFDKGKLDLWKMYLSDYSYDMIAKATIAVCKTEKYKPTPAHIIDEIVRQNASIPSIGEALRQIDSLFHNTKMTIHPMVAQYVSEYGMDALGMMKDTDIEQELKYNWKARTEDYIKSIKSGSARLMLEE